jgi:hypothetical protein
MAFWYPFKHRILNCTILSSRRRHLHSTLTHNVHYQVQITYSKYGSHLQDRYLPQPYVSITLFPHNLTNPLKSPSTLLPKAHTSSPAPAPQTPHAPPPAVASHPANAPPPLSPTSAVKAAVSAPQRPTTTPLAEAPSQLLVRQMEVHQ